MRPRFDAVLFDAGGVLVLPDSAVLGPLLAYYGGDPEPGVHHRAHYAGMKAKADVEAGETFWSEYNAAYVAAVGVAESERTEAAAVLAQTRSTWLWRQPTPAARESLALLEAAGIPIGVVSNASGQIEGVLARGICQVGPGPGVEVRCIVDSHVVGVAKPDPAIFDHALLFFEGIERQRIAYVGDSVTMDVGGATAAGLHPILIDPYADHEGEGFERITSIRDLIDELLAEATIDVEAPPGVVFDLFTTESGLLRWMATEASVDLRSGGSWRWMHDDGASCAGVYISIKPPDRVSFTYGWESGDFADVPPGSTRVDVTFEPTAGGTRVQVVHSGLTGDHVGRHAFGWAHFLGRLATALDSTTQGDQI